MAKLLNIGFEYQGSIHYSLIRVKEKEDWTEYQITIMDGNLEKLLYGNHIIREVNGHLIIDSPTDNEQSKLKYMIAQALSDYLKEQPDVSPDRYLAR